MRSTTRVVAESAGFDLMAQGKDRKYYMVGGKGGVGKTSCSSSLAVKFALAGHNTLLVSTDPAHSLSDSLDQDVTVAASLWLSTARTTCSTPWRWTPTRLRLSSPRSQSRTTSQPAPRTSCPASA